MRQKTGYSGVPADGLDPRAILQVCLCHHIRRSSRVLTRLYDAALVPSGLTAGQFTILTAIAALQPLPAPVLREILAMDRTSLNRAINQLKYKKLIGVTPGAGRRASVLGLTPEGAQALGDAGPLWKAAQADATSRLGAGLAGQLLSVLTASARAYCA